MISRYTNKFCIIHGHYALVDGHWWWWATGGSVLKRRCKCKVSQMVANNNMLCMNLESGRFFPSRLQCPPTQGQLLLQQSKRGWSSI